MTKMILAEDEFIRPVLGAEYTTAEELLASFEDDSLCVIEAVRVSALYGRRFSPVARFSALVEFRSTDVYGDSISISYLAEMTPVGAARRFGLDCYYDYLEDRAYPVRPGAKVSE